MGSDRSGGAWRRGGVLAAFMAGVLSAGLAQAACPDDAVVEQWAMAFRDLKPFGPPPEGLTYPDALCGQRKLVMRLSADLGPQVGWKVGATSPEAQKQLGINAPARGILLGGMLLPDATVLPARFGARPLVEADLMVTVADAGIMQAKDPAEAIRHLGELIPFIELTDQSWPDGARPDYGAIVAGNTGARLGVLGRRVRLKPTPEWVQALADMTVVLEDGVSAPIQAKGSSLLTHPLWSVIWLARDLAAKGESLRPGELVSLGSFAAARAPRPGTTIRLRYDGLPDGIVPTVQASFR